MAKRKALVVGINYAGSDAELHGAVNDALRWEKALESFGVHDTWVMVDEYPSGEVVGAEDDGSYSVPTKENILQGLDWLSAGASKGDCLTLIYCGRAAQVQGFAGAYPVEEALCPLDWEGSMTYYVITDQDLHRCFASLPAGVMLTVILDASLMGPPVRAPIKRSMQHPFHELRNGPPLQDQPYDENAWSQHQHVNALPRHVSRVVRRSFWTLLGRLLPDERKPLDEGLAVFCITACGPGQSAIEAYLNDSQQGVLTFCLLQALQNLRESTFLEWLTAADKEASKLRSKVMPAMDQFFEIAYGRHVGLESRLFDPACALLAKERAKRRRGESWQ